MKSHVLALVASCFLFVPMAHAEEGGSRDLRAPGHALRAEIQTCRERPPAGWDGREQYAWKVYLQKRASKMDGRLRKILKDQYWDLTGARPSVAPAQWTRFISEIASLHTELAAADKGYSRINVSETHAFRNWDVRHKRPRSINLSPSFPALTRIRRDILGHQRRRLHIPLDWISREVHLLQVVERELISRQEQWAAERKAARARFKAAADATRKALANQRADFGTYMGAARNWMSSLQLSEERRLQRQIAILTGEARKQAEAHVKVMARGRASALRFLARTPTGYGSLLRKQWAGPRTKVLGLLQAAAKAAQGPQGSDG